jgi:trigger factor
VTEVVDANVAATLETVRRQRAKYNRVERVAADGDLVNIDFEGLIAGQPFEGNKASNFTIVLGEKKMLPAFEESLVGLKEATRRPSR